MQSKLVAAKDYHEVALDIPAFVPDQAALQKELDRLRNPYVTWKPGGAAAAGDMVRCSLRSALPRFQKDSIRFVAGSGMYNPTLEALAIGMQAGEFRTATLPEGEVTLTVQAVQKRVVPALTDEMAAACKLPGVRTVAGYRRYLLAQQRDKAAAQAAWTLAARIKQAVLDGSAFVLCKADWKQAVEREMSNGAAGTLREYGYKGDIKVIRNGTDMTVPADPDALVARVNAEYGLADEENVLLFVGRVVEVKNLALAFGALRLLKGRMKFRFVIVGDGEGMKDYRAMAEEYGLADSVLFTGTITDREYLKAFYLRADLFVFPSVFDTASLCPIEGGGLRVARAARGGQPYCGDRKRRVQRLHTAPAEPHAWAERIHAALSDRAAHERVRGNCRRHVYRSWKDVVAEVEAEYDRLLTT